jgi:hypothetical protein
LGEDRERILVVGANLNKYFFPWVAAEHVTIAKPGGVLSPWLFWQWLRVQNLLHPEGYVTRQVSGKHIQKTLREYDKIILFDCIGSALLHHPLFAAQKEKKTFVYYWNPLPDNPALASMVAELKNYHKDVCSFQKSDCEKYGMTYHATMYAPPPEIPQPPISWDVVFLGAVKNRLEELRTIYQACRSQNLQTKFKLGSDDPALQEKREGWVVAKDWVSYAEEYIDWVRRSRCILDVNQLGQTGFSLRVMESIFFNKKLITNNPDVRGSDFYRPENVFILGEEDMEQLKSWIEIPFVPVPEEIKAEYTFERWLERFV